MIVVVAVVLPTAAADETKNETRVCGSSFSFYVKMCRYVAFMALPLGIWNSADGSWPAR